MTIPSASLKSRTTTPLSGPESRTSTPGPALQCGPGGSPTSHSSSTSSGGRTPEGTTNENCLHAGQPDIEIAASPSGPSQGPRGVARRVFRFFLKFICYRPSIKSNILKGQESSQYNFLNCGQPKQDHSQ